MAEVCGWWTPRRGVEDGEPVLARMLGPAGGGRICQAGGTFAFGLRGAGTAESGGVRAVIAGDAQWTDPGLADTARQRGTAHALLEAYARDGEDMVRHLRGPFLLVVLDERRDTLLAAIDRIGICRLYYAHHDGGLVFGSRPAPVLAHPFLPRELDLQAVYDYVYFHCIPSPRTIFRGISKLEPARMLKFSEGRLEVHAYWQPRFVPPRAEADAAALGAEMRELIETAVADRCGDPPPGAFLSGGLDSSTVAGYLKKLHPTRARTFTIGFDTPGYDESAYARISADHFRTEHHLYKLSPRDVGEALPRIAAALDEPFGNSSVVPTYYCARVAKEHGVAEMLAGDGGDELFAGNTRYAKQMIFDAYFYLPGWARKALELPFGLAPALKRMPLLRKADSYIEQANVRLPDRLQSYNFLHRFPPQQVFRPEFLKSIDTAEPVREWRDRYFEPQEAGALDRMLYLDWKFTLADNDLVKVNSMCELAGVTPRYPMLDERLIEFSTRVPQRLKMPGTRLRDFYKRAVRGFLADATIDKPKHGFGLPFGVWMRDDWQLQEIAGAAVAGAKGRGWFHAEFLDEITRLHLYDSAGYYGEFIWIIMILELWLQQAGPI